jgi:RNA polymerase sigma-70 factor (ECF subfamily)
MSTQVVRGAAALAFRLQGPDAARPNGAVPAVQACVETCILRRRQAMRASAKKSDSLSEAAHPAARGREAREIDDHALVEALRRSEPWARVILVERFEPHIERLVAGALGFDPELADVVNDVFVRVFEKIHQLKDPGALRGWIASLAVFTARGHIRRRRRRRWLHFFAPHDLPEVPAPTATPEQCELLHSAYRALDQLPEDERIAFSLRFIAEMELTEVATACQVSLATIKRRLARADVRFRAEADRHPLLRERLLQGRPWKSP